jgi:hypothetical protein
VNGGQRPSNESRRMTLGSQGTYFLNGQGDGPKKSQLTHSQEMLKRGDDDDDVDDEAITTAEHGLKSLQYFVTREDK